MRKNINSLKLESMLQNYDSLSNHINSFIARSYEVGFGTLASTIGIGAYAVLNTNTLLFCILPFILFVGAIIYSHITYNLIKFSAHRKKVENKLNNFFGRNNRFIDIETEIGLFSQNRPFLSQIIILFIFTISFFATIIKGFLCASYANKTLDFLLNSHLTNRYIPR
jgi:hypothetical protein